jgi:hypothetical protein
MSNLVVNGERITVAIAWLMAKCRPFQTKLELLGRPY